MSRMHLFSLPTQSYDAPKRARKVAGSRGWRTGSARFRLSDGRRADLVAQSGRSEGNIPSDAPSRRGRQPHSKLVVRPSSGRTSRASSADAFVIAEAASALREIVGQSHENPGVETGLDCGMLANTHGFTNSGRFRSPPVGAFMSASPPYPEVIEALNDFREAPFSDI
jgi:hypothetical protein